MNRLRLIVGHTSIPPMIAVVLVGVCILLWQAPAWLWILVLLGIPAQMLNEYGLHRYIFHLPPPEKQWAFDLLYQAHYGHHDFPTNVKLFFAPIWVTLPVLALNFMVVWGLLSLIVPLYAFNIAVAMVLVGGTSTFLGYEWFHMTAHVSGKRTKIEQHVATLHNQHHFRDFSRWFHVSPGGEVIDRIMGTAINRDDLCKQQRIAFIRTLGMRPDDLRLQSARQRFAKKYGLSAKEIEIASHLPHVPPKAAT